MVMKRRCSMKDSDNVVMIMWEWIAIEMESYNYARNKVLLGMMGAMCVMRDESKDLFCVRRETGLQRLEITRMRVKGKRIDLESGWKTRHSGTPLQEICTCSLLSLRRYPREMEYIRGPGISE